MSKIVDNVVVFGGGAWGTALAKTISQNVEQVFIYLRDPELINEINQKHTDIDEFLTEETVLEFFSDWESYDSSILRGIIKIVERFDLETQFKIISSAGHDGVTPLMNAPQISDEAVQILLQAIKKFSAEKRFELFAQRSEKQSSPLLLSAMNNQAGLNAMLAEISTYSYENRLELLSAKNIENANILTLAMRSNTNDSSAIKLLIELIGTLHEDEQINLVFNESIYGDHALASSICNGCKANVYYSFKIKGLLETIQT